MIGYNNIEKQARLGCFRITATIGYCIKMLHLTLFTKEKWQAQVNTKLDHFGVTATIGYSYSDK